MTYYLQVFVLIYNIIGAVQTRLGLGLPVNLRPQANLPLYSKVGSPVSLIERENHANGGFTEAQLRWTTDIPDFSLRVQSVRVSQLPQTAQAH
jgi:hypothetical protein